MLDIVVSACKLRDFKFGIRLQATDYIIEWIIYPIHTQAVPVSLSDVSNSIETLLTPSALKFGALLVIFVIKSLPL